MLYLASHSPRRKQLLSDMGLPFTCIPNQLEQEVLPETGTPQEKAETLAQQKAIASALGLSEGLVIGVDTMVVLDDQILGKPKTPHEAHEMLHRLSGRTHQVITAICVYDVLKKKTAVGSAIAYVTFNPLSETDITHYIQTQKPFDKAGSYGIQDIPPSFLKQLQGRQDAVMGLCTDTLKRLLL